LGRRKVSQKQIMRTAMDFVDGHEHDCLTLDQLATATGVSERTLRNAFHCCFGIPPMQYLHRRTIRQVRKALKGADASETTVTQIATQFGIWQFGGMARDYRILLGELPSESLRDRALADRCSNADQ